MGRLKDLSILMSVVIVVALFSAASLVQAASPNAAGLGWRLPPTRTPTARPTIPTPVATATPTPPPQPACWAIVAGPTLPGYASELHDVAGSADNDLWAVGSYSENSIRHTLAMHWNGCAWEVVSSPDVVTTGTSINNVLNAVAVVASNDVWAVGYAASTSVAYRTVTLHWNGSTWQVVPSPNVATPGFYNALNDVTAIAANDIWAVGGVPANDLSGVSSHSLLMHWDGSSWQLSPEPPETATWSTTSRVGVAARSSSDVWAVGQFAHWRWDGSVWQVPNSNSGQNLTGIDANGGSLWSVGTNRAYRDSGGGYYPSSPIAQWFNGATWQSTNPLRSGNGDGFNAVRVISANNVWAVGFSGRSVLTEKWNGSQWAVITGANGNPSANNVLLGVNTVSANRLWAVGYYYDTANMQRLLIERYVCQ